MINLQEILEVNNFLHKDPLLACFFEESDIDELNDSEFSLQHEDFIVTNRGVSQPSAAGLFKRLNERCLRKFALLDCLGHQRFNRVSLFGLILIKHKSQFEMTD